MGIANQHGVTGYRRTMVQRLEGAPAEFETPLTQPYRNPLAAQANNIAIGTYDTDTDAVGVEITLPNGDVITHTITRAAGVPADATAAAVALAAAIEADDDLSEVVDATSSTTNVVLAFRHENIVYPIEATASAGTTATLTETQAPGGDPFPFARFVAAGTVLDGIPAIAELGTDADEYDVVGITLRPIGQFANAGSALATAVDGIEAGCMGDVAFQGAVTMRNVGSVASTINGVVHVVINDAGDDEVGQARADSDTGGTEQVITVTPTAGQNSVTVALQISLLTGPNAGYSANLIYETDADMTATEVADAFRTDIAANTILTANLTSSGTATLILTADDPEITFDVEVVEGLFTIADTTAAVPYTIPLSRSRARWAEVVAPGELGTIRIDM